MFVQEDLWRNCRSWVSQVQVSTKL